MENSGIGVVIRSILSRWIANHPEVQFHVLCRREFSGEYAWLKEKNVEATIWDAPIYSVREHFRQVPNASFPIDITWVPHYNVSLALPGPIVSTIHDVLHLEQEIVPRGLIQRLYAKSMMNWTRRRSRGIVFVSKFTQDMFHAKVGMARNEAVIWNGVDPIWFESKLKSRADAQEPYVVFVGNGFPHKNLSRLIRSMKSVWESHGVRLKIVGNFDGLKTVDREAMDLALANQEYVHLMGKLSFENLRTTVAGSSALVFPSLYEGFGLPPLEALAQGIPVVVSDIPVHKEIFNGIAHFAEPYSEEALSKQIINAINDPADPDTRRSFARRFSWDDSAKRMMEFLL